MYRYWLKSLGSEENTLKKRTTQYTVPKKITWHNILLITKASRCTPIKISWATLIQSRFCQSISFRFVLILSSNLYLILKAVCWLQVARCPTKLIFLNLIIPIFDKHYNLWSHSLHNFLPSFAFFPPSGPYIPNTLFSSTLCLSYYHIFPQFCTSITKQHAKF